MLRKFAAKINIALLASTAVFIHVNAQALEITEAVQLTLDSNPEVLAELRETDARERQVREALGGFYPTVDLTAGFGFQERDPTSQTFPDEPNRTRNELERSETQLNIRQLVFDGFYTEYEHENQKSRLLSQQLRTENVGESISLEVVRVYMDVIKQQELLDLAKETLAFHQQTYDTMGKRFDSGVGSRADFDQISGRLALAQVNLQNQIANLQNARVNFQRIVGRFPTESELAYPGTYRKYLPESVEGAVETAIQKHPLLKSANVDVDAVQNQYKQTKSDFYPHFHVEVERDLNKNIDGLEGQVDDLQVMLRMRYNLYRGRSDQARTQRFAHLVEKAKEIRNNTRRQVEQEVRLAWTSYEALKNQLPSLENYVRDSSATKEAYINQFDLGRRTLLDLLNTQNEMIDAKRSYINAQNDMLYGEYRLFRSMGELMYTVGAKL